MLGWIIRLLLVIAGAMTSWFVAKDALNFAIVQMVVAVVLFTSVIALFVFWPSLKASFNKLFKKR